MREHQIIINLKPEHYQELERLSRASGARSVSVFVKERMLASLGIDGRANVANAPGSLNVAAVTSDIRRLHRDLQVFVAESLSGRDFGYVGGSSEQESLTPGAELARAVAEADATQTSTQKPQAPADRMNALAEPVVSVDQLAPLGNPPPISSPAISPASGPSQSGTASTATTGAQETSQALPSNQAIPRQQGRSPLRGRGSGASFSGIIPGLPSFRTAQLASSNLKDPADSDSAPPSEPSTAPKRDAGPSTVPAASSVASPHNNLQPAAEVPDDLEELAERAFAISPRLGAMEEIDDDAPMFSDPLDELLGEIEDEEIQRARSTQVPVAPASAAATTSANAAEVLNATSGSANAGLEQPEFSEHINEDVAVSDYERADATESEDTAGLTTVIDAEIDEALESLDARSAQDQSVIAGPDRDYSADTNNPPDATVAHIAHNENAARSNKSTSNDFTGSGPDWDDATDETNETARNEQEDAADDSSQSDAGTGSQDEENTNQSGTSTGFPQNPPPISGGPPPRRRRT